MEFLFYAIAAALSLLVYPYVVNFWFFWKTVFRCVRVEAAQADQVPEHFKAIFAEAIAQLEPSGFCFLSYHRVAQGSVREDKIWGVLLQHSSLQTYAGLVIYQPINPANPVGLNFFSHFQDDYRLLTTNTKAFNIFSHNPKDIDQYIEEASIQQQWQTHQHQLEQLSQTNVLQTLTPEAFVEVYETHEQQLTDQWVHTQEIQWVQPGKTYKLTWRTALKATFQSLSQRKQPPKREALSIPPSTDELSSPTPIVQIEVDEFYRWQKQQRHGRSRRSRSWILLGTLALFAASLLPIFEPQTLIIFVVVLLLHEAGHVLAMKLFGYQDTAMLFIPFLGGLATARKDNASLSEKIWITLAGPLPGLLLGVALSVAYSIPNGDYTAADIWLDESNRMRQIIQILIGLNLFNLLPIYPLDGGQITNLLLFSRYPYFGVAFKIIGVLLIGILSTAQPLLLIFAGLVAVSIPNSFQSAKLNARLRKELQAVPSEDQAANVQFIFEHLQFHPYGKLPFAQKYELAIGWLESQRENLAKRTTRLGLAGIYLVSLLIGLIGGLYSLLPSWTAWSNLIFSFWQEPTVYQKQIQQELQYTNEILQADPNNVEAYLQRAQAKILLEDYEGAIADSNAALQIDPNSPDAYITRGDARYYLNDTVGGQADYEQSNRLVIAQANQVLSQNPKDVAAYLQRANGQAGLNNYTAAIEDCNQALQLEPTNLDALWNRGSFYLELQDYHRAIADANRILQIQPEFVDAYYLRSQARRALGDEAGAVADEQLVKALDGVEEGQP